MLLETRHLSRGFGGIIAVNDVSLQIVAGVLHTIIGPNGAGKSTLFNLLTRQTEPTDGQVLFKGQDITRLPPHALPGLGIARSFQKTELFWKLSVYENVRVAVQTRAIPGLRVFRPAVAYTHVLDEVEKILDLVGLTSVAAQPAAALSHGDQRLTEIAVALGSGPQLLLLDEPLAGMSSTETERAAQLFIQLKALVTLVLIEHDMDVVLAISDRITVLDLGRIISDGTPAEVQASSEVQRTYFGREEV